MRHSKGDAKQKAGAQRGNPKDRGCSLSHLHCYRPSQDVQRFSDGSKERKAPELSSQNSRGLDKEAPGEVGTSRTQQQGEDEAGRENSSAGMGRAGAEGEG